ncbi:hypothetical protein MLD38_010002 [Melastoma candidum]|uniref:Uncharacterized protein n=1 Tax=Melastoma candidum TaxID=119954 RepID=A0ACB9R1I2_9MYRT|nr:hypothetical protein MLD38_010002 [Melastoma candidum]
MAEEFYTASAGLHGGNWWSSPRDSMYPSSGISSPCFLDVSNLYLPVDYVKCGRICDDYGGIDKPGYPAWDHDFSTERTANGYSSTNLPYWNQTLFEDGEKLAELESYASNPMEFSLEDSSALAQSFLFRASELCSGRGTYADDFNERNQAASSEYHFSKLERVSPPSFTNVRSNSKTSGINNTRPSNTTATVESKATDIRPWTVDSQAQRGLSTQLRNDVGGKKKEVNSSTKRSTNMVESGLKRPRTETPSPLPTFKVRKEKLGDRITALQQLVSPFGKTDTASVLHEAIDYIKFLHDQVHVLSSPYMKNGRPQGFPANGGGFSRRELRSQGLCLVPVSSTFPIVCEAPGDFWTPKATLVGSNFR